MSEVNHCYKKCYVAFLDILGFKEFLKNKQCEEIYQLLDEVDKIELKSPISFIEEKQNIPLEMVRKYVISDSIILAIDVSIPNSLLALVKQCQKITCCLISRCIPILLRGAISKGDFYDEVKNGFIMIYGKAYNDSYLLEERSAKVPRIIMLHGLINEFKEEKGVPDNIKRYIDDSIYIDEDGYACIEYINLLNDESKNNCMNYAQCIIDNCDEDRKRDKYLYLKKWLLKHQVEGRID